jgi:hypothetical protein
MFNYPVGVQLFNRPDYARRLLISIKTQSCPVDMGRLFIFIDGFSGSVYQKRGLSDQTVEVESLAQEIFPDATIVKFIENRGIADVQYQLQEMAFSSTETWAAFFEEDIVLEPTYLQELSELINIVDDCESVSKVACFQMLGQSNLPRGYDGFYNGHGTKAFAERKNFFLDKSPMMKAFIALEKRSDIPKHYPTKKSDLIKDSTRLAHLANPNALGTLMRSFNKDLAIDHFLHLSGKLHVVTKPNLATDIGIDGVHSYVVPQVQVGSVNEARRKSTSERKAELLDSLETLDSEAQDFYFVTNRVILDGFMGSLSGKILLQRLYEIVLKKVFDTSRIFKGR